MLDRWAADVPDKVFLRFGEVEITFGAARRRVRSVANRLLELGVEPGDTIALFTPNCAEWVEVWLAATEIGAVTTPVNVAFRDEFLAHQLRDSGARFVMVESAFVPLLAAVASQLPDLRLVLVRGELPDAVDLGVDVVAASTLYEGDESEIRGGQPLAWNEPAFVFYTSGTTGLSKGAVLSQNYLLASSQLIGTSYGYRHDDAIFGAVPLFHLSGTQGVLVPSLLNGITGTLDSGFHPGRCWDRVREIGATVFVGVGAMVLMLWDLPPDPSDVELPLRLLVAAPIPAELHHAIEARYGLTIASAYGLTEIMPVSIQTVGDPVPPGSAGRASPNLDVMIVGDDDDEVPVGTVGEIVCRPLAAHVMFDGYRGRPDATVEQTRNLWFHTGDLGRFDDDGNLYFVDRKKDAMRRRGENISSVEVERAVLAHPAVAECAAHGVPSQLGEDDVKICVVLVPATELTHEALLEHCVERLPKFAVPRYIEMMDALPKNAVGRVQKMKLREHPLGPGTWDAEAKRS